MRLYHATIKIKLDLILSDKAIKPGQSFIDVEDDLPGLFGFYDHYSDKHVYAWTNKRDAINCARSLRRNASPRQYTLEERQAVVIPFNVELCLVSIDPDCGVGSGGRMVYGEVRDFDEPIFV